MGKWIGVFIAAAVLLFGVDAEAAKIAPEISASTVYRNSDNPAIEDGVGIALEVSTEVQPGLSAGLELNVVNQDLVAPMGGIQIGELDTIGLFGNIKYQAIQHRKLNLDIGGGIGFLFVDPESDISGLGLDADNTLALKAFAEWAWQIHGPDADDPTKFSAEVFGQVAYMIADSDLEVQLGSGPTRVVKDQDLDALDLRAGVRLTF